jgi:hypothetical protein
MHIRKGGPDEEERMVSDWVSRSAGVRGGIDRGMREEKIG